MEGIQFIFGIICVGAAYTFFRRSMTDFLLFLLFVIIPFFRIFDGALLRNIHIIITVAGVVGGLLGLLFNKLEEYTLLLLKYLIPVALATIAIHFFLETYDSAQIKITLLETAGPIVLIVWIIRRIKIGNFIPPTTRRYAVLPAVLFLASGLISFAFSQFKLETFEPGLLRRIAYIGVYLAVVYEYDRETDFRRVANWVLASCFVATAYGFIQYMGWDWHVWAGAFGRRVFSTFGNPNFFGAWLVLVFPLAVVQALITKKWYYFLLVFLILFNSIHTYTMGCWLGIAASIAALVILGVLYLIKGNPRLLKRIAGGIVFSIFIITISGVIVMSMRRPRSITFRLFTWGSTMKMISEPIPDFASPARAFLMGHGIESFNLVYPSYRRPEIFHLERKHNTQTDHAHNEYMEVFFDEGFIGLVVFIWFLSMIFYAALKRLSMIGMGGVKFIDEYYLVALIAGTMGLLVHAGLDVNPRFVSSGYIMWAFFGLIVVQSTPLKQLNQNGRKKEKDIKYPGIMQILTIIILLAVGIRQTSLAHGRFIANKHHNQAIAFSRRRMWDQAIHHYKIVQEKHPAFIMAYYFEGNVYNDRLSEAMREGNRQQARMFYDKAIDTYSNKVRAMYPNYVQLHFQEGMLHMRYGDMDEAIRSFRRYLNIVDPVYTHTYYRLGEIYARRNEIKMARLYMEEALRRKPWEIDAYMNLANLYRVMGEINLAEKTYRAGTETLQEEEEKIQAARQLAQLYRETGREEEARAILEEFN